MTPLKSLGIGFVSGATLFTFYSIYMLAQIDFSFVERRIEDNCRDIQYICGELEKLSLRDERCADEDHCDRLFKKYRAAVKIPMVETQER